MSAWAKPGVKCVCIADLINGPELREVCTITATESFKGRLYVYLDGYDSWRRVAAGKTERWSWCSSAFRPLASRTEEQDVAIFRPILTSISVGEDA